MNFKFFLREKKKRLTYAVIILCPKVWLGKLKGTTSPKVELRDPGPTQAPLVFNPHIEIV